MDIHTEFCGKYSGKVASKAKLVNSGNDWSYFGLIYRCFSATYVLYKGPASSVGIATGYGLDSPGIEFRWGRDFPLVQTGPGAHPTSCTMGTGSFPGIKYGRGVLLTTHPLLVPRSWKSRAITLPTLWATTGPVTGTLYLYILCVT